MEIMTNKIYARIDERGIVTKLFSSVFEESVETDILIEEGNEEHHAHVHLKYQLMDEQCRYNYIVKDGVMTGLTVEEKEVLFPVEEVVYQPTLEERYAELEMCVLELAEMVGGMQ